MADCDTDNIRALTEQHRLFPIPTGLRLCDEVDRLRAESDERAKAAHELGFAEGEAAQRTRESYRRMQSRW